MRLIPLLLFIVIFCFRSTDLVSQTDILKRWRAEADSVERITGKYDKRFERMYAMAAPRYSGTSLLKTKRQSLFEISADYQKNHKLKANQTHNGSWEFVGGTSVTYTNQWARPGGGVGLVNCVEFHPTDPNTFLVGTAAGGIWRTTDHGVTWVSITDGFPSLSVSSIEYNPLNTNEIYALIGDGDGGDSNFRTVGVIRTLDNGDSWYATNFLINSRIHRPYKLILDETDPCTQYLVTDRGFYQTQDCWDTNQRLFVAAPTTTTSKLRCYDLEFRPGSFDTVYFSTGVALYRFVNNGSNLIDTIFAFDIPDSIGHKRIEFEISPTNPDLMYVLQGQVQGSTTGFAGLFFSSDAGDTWAIKSMNSPNIFGNDTIGTSLRSQATYDIALAIHPNDPSRVMMGGINAWGSIDTGTTWVCKTYFLNNTTYPYLHSDIHDLVYNGNNLYACTDGGISVSYDHGESYIDIGAGLGIGQIYRLTSSVQNPDIIYAGLQDNGNNRFYPDGHMDQVTNEDGMECVINPKDSNTVYVSAQRGRLHRSSNGADEFTEVIGRSSSKPWTTPLEMHPTSPDTLLFGSSGGNLIRSFNRMSIASQRTIDCIYTPIRLRFAPSDPNTVYTVPWRTQGDSLTRSDNILSSSAFDVVFYGIATDTNFFSPPSLSDLAIDPNNKEHIFVTYSGFQAGNKVSESEDGGNTWENISGNLPNVPVNCIVYETGSNDGLYIGTDIGVFYRNADMIDWIWFGNRLPSVLVTDLEINYTNRTILAGTFGRGIWRSHLYSDCPDVLSLTGPQSDPSIYTGILSYEADDQLVSDRLISGGVGTNVQYQSNGFISLLPGFRAKESVFFEARIDRCTEDTELLIFLPFGGNTGLYAGRYPYDSEETHK